MRIDITSPDGNVFAALGIATRFMRQAKRSQEDIDALRSAVMSAKNYKEACAAITDATHGCIEFYNSLED